MARVTRGDAEAVLQAFGNGGWVILKNRGLIPIDFPEGVGSPAQTRAMIKPNPGSAFDGRHYCAEDWHVVLATWADGGDASFTMQDAKAAMDAVTIELFLDGKPLHGERTSIKPLLAPPEIVEGMKNAFYFQQGAVLPPSALAVGSHTAGRRITEPGASSFAEITFHIDAPGTGSCL